MCGSLFWPPSPFPFASLPVVAVNPALDHFVPPLIPRHNEGSEGPTTAAKRAECYPKRCPSRQKGRPVSQGLDRRAPRCCGFLATPTTILRFDVATGLTNLGSEVEHD